MTIRIPTPVSGGLLLSYKCNATCRHCMYACSPKWKADWISEEDLIKILSQLEENILQRGNRSTLKVKASSGFAI
jgi:MoaA/NifB/PqqE/SkfB family radical SAM enzyme